MIDLQHVIGTLLAFHTVGNDLPTTTMLLHKPSFEQIICTLEQQYDQLMSSETNIHHSFMEQLGSSPNDVRDTLFEESGLAVLAHLSGKIPADTRIESFKIEPALADDEICKAIHTGYYTNPKSLLKKLISQQSHSLQRAFEIKDKNGKKLVSMLHARTCRKKLRQEYPTFYVSTVQEIIKNVAQYASREQLQSQLDNVRKSCKRDEKAKKIIDTLKEVIQQWDENRM